MASTSRFNCRLDQKEALGCSSSCSRDCSDGVDDFLPRWNNSNTLLSSPAKNKFLNDFISRLSSFFFSSFSVDAGDDDVK